MPEAALRRRRNKVHSAIRIVLVMLFVMALRASAQQLRESPMSVYQSERMAKLEAKHDNIIARQEALSDRLARIEGIGAGFGGVLILLDILNLLKGGAPTRRIGRGD